MDGREQKVEDEKKAVTPSMVQVPPLDMNR